MAKYKVAHIHEQGNDMIIIPLDSSFNNKTDQQQADEMDGIEVGLLFLCQELAINRSRPGSVLVAPLILWPGTLAAVELAARGTRYRVTLAWFPVAALGCAA